jgi:hypothetical protein
MTHHAYYIEGPLSHFAQYKDILRPFAASAYERFGIDEARELIALASLKNFNEATFFVALSSITSEAQQALLKLFEEPQEGTTFVLLVPHGSLLPTLRSRMLAYPDPLESGPELALAKEFLAASGKARSDLIAAVLKDEEGTKERARDLINALETELSKQMGDPAARQALEDIAKVRDYLRDRSPSLKMLLEHLAVCIPAR